MPEWAEKKIKSRGGATRWRTVKKGGKTLRCAVTKKAGPQGGKTVCYEIGSGSGGSHHSAPDGSFLEKRKKKFGIKG